MKKCFLGLAVVSSFSIISTSYAATNAITASASIPQPTACIQVLFSGGNNPYYNGITIILKNNCKQSVDIKNATLTFNNATSLNTNFWGNFTPLTYPGGSMQITSQPKGNENIASLTLQFPQTSWVTNTLLPPNGTITLSYGENGPANYNAGSAKVYLNGQAVQSGEIDLVNTTAQPPGVTDAPWIDIESESTKQIVSHVQTPWGNIKKSVTGLSPDIYDVIPVDVTDSEGIAYTGAASPSKLTINANQKADSNIRYVQIAPNGTAKIKVQGLPDELAGYINKPEITLTRADKKSALSIQIPWNNTTTIEKLANHASYDFSALTINYNGYNCIPHFDPVELISNDTAPQTTNLTYVCAQKKQDAVTVNVTGLPVTTSLLDVTFIPSDGTTPITKILSISDGKGSDVVQLTDGVIFNVNVKSIDGYTASFSSQPFTATYGGSERVTYQPSPVISSIYSAYKDATINMNWDTGIVNTKVTGVLTPFIDVLSTAGSKTATLAFATGTCGQETWGGIQPDVFASNNIPLFEKKNINYIISTGGAAGTFTCSSVSEMKKFIDRYNSKNFAGIDFDIEGGDPTQLIQTMAATQKQFYPNLRVSLTIATLAASDGTQAGVNTLGDTAIRVAKAAGLKFTVNLMVMDYGSAIPANCVIGTDGKCDMAASAIQAAQNLNHVYGIPFRSIELTPMIGDNDARDEMFSLSNAKTLAYYIRDTHLAGLHYWSFDRDVGCNPKTSWASPTCNNSSDPGKSLQFNNVFSQAIN